MNAAILPQTELAPYRQPVDEVLAALGTDARLGLSADEAQARLKSCGRNELTAEKAVPAWRKFLAQFQDALVILLLVATLISAGLWLYERDSALPYEAIAILAVQNTYNRYFKDWVKGYYYNPMESEQIERLPDLKK